MTKIDIFSGFLGAGKTTLIRKLIKEAYSGEKIVLIENEFGEISIDGDFLQDAGIEITEMSQGCICCSLVGDFTKALKKVLDEMQPERIIIEPSGVGKLSDVIKAVQKVDSQEIQLNSFTTVCDAKKIKMYVKNFGEFYNDQVEHANCIVLSRSKEMSEEKLEEVVDLIKEKNPVATIITTDWALITGKQIEEAMEHENSLEKELALLEQEAKQHHHSHEHHHHHHHGECCEGEECCHHEHEHEECDEHECCCHHEHEEHEHHHHHDHDHEESDEHECCCHHHEHEHEESEEHECCCHHHEHEHDESEEHECCCHHHEHEHEESEEHECCCHHHEHEHEEHEHHHHHDHEECDDPNCSCHHHHHEHEECDDPNCSCHDHNHNHHADEVFTSWGKETSHKYSIEEIKSILKELDNQDKYGLILRSKGIIEGTDGNWIYFDYVPEEVDIRSGAPITIGRFCVIGSKINEEALKELFK